MLTKQFFIAGKAVFTIEVPPQYRKEVGKERYTYRVKYSKGNERWPACYFVSLLTGPNNTQDYTYIGKLDPETGAVETTFKSKDWEDTYPLALVRRLLAIVWETGDLEPVERLGFRVHHEGKCGRCGRALTVPESIESGLGPVCAGM